MKKHIKIVAGVLALTLVFSGGIAVGRNNVSVTSPVTASADTYECFSYKVQNNEVCITACDRDVTDVIIPSEIDGLPVTAIAEYSFRERTNLVSVTIPDSVKTISRQAFENCTSLSSVIIPDSVTAVEKYTFAGCTSLEAVTFSKNLSAIGTGAFENCISLTSLTFPDGLTSVESSAFSGCEKLTDITFPESLTDFGMLAFNDTQWLTEKRAENPIVIVNNVLVDAFECKGSVVIPDGVKKIGGACFANTTKITSVTVPDSVETVGEYAFYQCNGITSVTLPESVNYIGNNAFYDNSSLKVVTVMNPDCEIYDHPNTLNGLVINGYENSTAQAYAEKYSDKYGCVFVRIGDPIPDIPVQPTIKKGDVNEDGLIDVVDASIILSYYSYTSTTTDSPVMTLDEYMDSMADNK